MKDIVVVGEKFVWEISAARFFILSCWKRFKEIICNEIQ